MLNTEKSLDQIVSLCKGRGFVYPGSEIYGGLANTWDYGPLGVELKTNIKDAWRKKFIQENKYNVGLELLRDISAASQIRLWTAASVKHVTEPTSLSRTSTAQMLQAGATRN